MANPVNRAPLAPNAPTEAQTDETRMRRALGLSASGNGGHTPQQRPDQARQRHRFVQDGGVPVVVLNHKTDTEATGLRERIAALETQLEAERAAHKAARAALAEQQAQTTALTTRLTHDGLAHQEAIAQERALRIHAQEALAAIAAAPAIPRRPARPTEPMPADAPAVAAEASPPKAKRGRPRSTTPPEPKPVRWWTPSFKAKMKA